MKKNKIIYSLSVEDILTIIDENDINIKLDDRKVSFIQDKVGDLIDWRSALEFALFECQKKFGTNNE